MGTLTALDVSAGPAWSVTPPLLHELFEAQADARPEATAVVFGAERITYAELEAQANRMARHLRARGVGRGSVVAILLPRSLEAYAAILAVLKAGAAYVPIDPGYPPDRVAYILENAKAHALVATAELFRRCGGFAGAVVRTDADRALMAGESGERLRREVAGAEPSDLCYLIYTSGSTGRPKGVMIEHRNASHLVRAESRIYRARASDRVYQGASLAFDLSVEEIWLAFAAGGTLVAATPEMGRAGPDLSRWLAEAGVTVLSCVPTLLAMLEEDVPTLRLIILGGEVCPAQLAERWARPGRRIVNTYGPTETTVIATYAELDPGKPVTIGRPVPGYRVYLLDDRLRPVARGEIGEICISGAGVARGYVGLPAETHRRFVPDPFAPSTESAARMYRTGDYGRFDDAGHLEFHGRRDGQVKLRGFRVELSEIESALLGAEGIRAAACAVREDAPGVQQLVAYVVPGAGGSVDEQGLRSRLAARLPACMVPAIIETVADLPQLPSGKLDRASLPAPQRRQAARGGPSEPARTDSERRIAQVWQALFDPLPISVNDDFFRDLGGHSLLAARMISALRKEPRFASVSMLDVYEHPTVRSLAAALDSSEAPRAAAQQPGSTEPARNSASERKEAWRHGVTGGLQAVSVWFPMALRGLQWVTPYLVFFLLRAAGYPLGEAVTWMAATAMAVFPATLAVAIAAKWVVLGRIQPGRHRLWGAYYFRWWLVRSVLEAAHLSDLAGTPLMVWAYRLLGAKVGRDVYLASERLGAFDLISIGDGSSVDETAGLLGYAVEGRQLVIGPVTVGRNCYIGNRAILGTGAVMEDGARLDDLSMLPAGARVPRGESWAGSPARPAPCLDPAPSARPPGSGVRRAAIALLYAAAVLLLPVADLIAFLPFLAVFERGDFFQPSFLLLLPLVGAAFVAIMAAEVVLGKWLLEGRVRPGAYPVDGGFYLRHWVVERLLAHGLEVVAPIHATVYTPFWYRALGAKIGKLVELSTAYTSAPDLLALGDGSTVADEVSLGTPRVEGGWMTVAPTRLGRRSFVGNSGVVPAGVSLGDGSLIGVLSVAPSDPAQAARKEASWLGSPPILLPRRQASARYLEERTYCPPRQLRLARGCCELLRITLPISGYFFVSATVIEAGLRLWHLLSLPAVLLLLPFVYAAACLGVLAGVAAVKWIVIGRYRPFERPLWTGYIWRLELVNALYEFLATPLALDFLQGTPLLAWYLRLLGVRIGRCAYLETTGFLEWDVTELGDRVSLNQYCVLQTHLFEDRVLKSSWVRIGDDCEVGADSVVLYDSEMQRGSRLDALSLLMKGETLPAGTAWWGSPLAGCAPRRTPRDDARHWTAA